MSGPQKLALCLLSVGQWTIPAVAQSTGDEFRPELGIYIQEGPLIRLEFVDSFQRKSTGDWRGNFAFYVQTALKPALRRELRDHPDVYRDKYLTMRAGYRYQTPLASGQGAHEHRGILELTARYKLPWEIVISDRHRGEFRFVQGQPFSTRYRNRLRLERDVPHAWCRCTPYVYDEIYYDSRYHQWTPNGYAAGIEFPVGRHAVLEPYYLRQKGSYLSPPHINAFGFKLNLYF
jgi:hypothetical protein